jgi:hypothetical protein
MSEREYTYVGMGRVLIEPLAIALLTHAVIRRTLLSLDDNGSTIRSTLPPLLQRSITSFFGGCDAIGPNWKTAGLTKTPGKQAVNARRVADGKFQLHR